MNDQRLLDDVARTHARIQRRVRILKYHLHVAPGRAHPAAIERQDVLAAKPHLAGRRLDQPQHASAGRALAAARFADQPVGLALLDGEAHIVHGADDRLRRAEGRRRDRSA